AVALATRLFRRNRAAVRHSLWLAASVKFLVPFALVVSVGSYLPWAPTVRRLSEQTVWLPLTPAASSTAGTLGGSPPSPEVPDAAGWPRTAMLAIWALGFIALAATRARTWQRIRAAVGGSTTMALPHTGLPPDIALRAAA